MNVIFLDFDGVLNTWHDYYSTKQEVNEKYDKRIKILSDICKKYDCKVVIEASVKSFIDEETLETDVDWVNKIFKIFKKYDIECIGRTPDVIKRINEHSSKPIWKEDEIRLYLFRHPEIDHYVVIDDDDAPIYCGGISDLDKVRKHLVKTVFIASKEEEEGLLEKYSDEVGEKLKEANEIKKFALKRKNK